MSELKERYPRTVDCKGRTITLDRLKALDTADAKQFTSNLTDMDLMFLSRDLREPKVIEAWNRSIESGDIISVAAWQDGRIIGTTAVVCDKLSWSPHVGELRILVSPEARDIGLGRQLIQESFLIGLYMGLEKLTVRMTLDQERAVSILEDMGFKTEALLKDHTKDTQGRKHDLLMMSHDVEAGFAKLAVLGIEDAL
ncbi:MAG: GNAT family N-acetyltransferase [Proteobacteria bacterium]|nr:GNAT family N-acetyltransferase [Pseudomonadota bacterium]